MSDPPFLIFGAPAIGEAEIAEVEACLRSDWLGTGPRIKARGRAIAPELPAFDLTSPMLEDALRARIRPDKQWSKISTTINECRS